MFFAMVFMFCFFLGSLAMFLYLLRKLDTMARSLSDEHAQMRVLLRAMESRLDKLAHMEKISAILQGQTEASEETSEKDDRPGHDALLHLSFERPQPLDGLVDPGLDLNLEPQTWEVPEKQAPEKQAPEKQARDQA